MADKRSRKNEAVAPWWPEFEVNGFHPDDPEWEHAWRRLGMMTGDGDRTALEEESNECWQYVCSLRYADDPELGWLHEFRHRRHPTTQRRWVILIPASRGWNPDDVSCLAEAEAGEDLGPNHAPVRPAAKAKELQSGEARRRGEGPSTTRH